MPANIFIGIGSNVGDRLTHLRWAVKRLNAHPELVVSHVSSVYESDAHVLDENLKQESYLNAVIGLQGAVTPSEMLELCLALEAERGRLRQPGIRWEPRTLDLDILAFDRSALSTEPLSIPHPRLFERNFVLEPWNEIAPEFVVPEPFGEKVAVLLARCSDLTAVQKTNFQLLD